MDSALEDIEFLALSANRVEVLNALREGSYTRQELQEDIPASQPTLGRILRDLSDRQWITHDGEAYSATATGQLVAEEFINLWETLQGERQLREVVEWMPTESMEFDLRCLADATVTIPSHTRPGAPVQRVLGLVQQSDHVMIFSHAFNEQSLNVIHQQTVEGAQTFEAVLSSTAIDAIAHDSSLRHQLQELTDSEAAEIRLYDGDIPLAVTITDDVVHLLLRDDDGLLRAAVDTDDESVLAWAREKHEQYWQHSSRLS
jgi:predicted transcriptional regulator